MYWHLVHRQLGEDGHDVVSPDLPCYDDSAGLGEYTDAVVDAIGDREDLVVVLESWPKVPTRILLCRDDRLFPADWLRGDVQKRLGIEPDEIDGGHCVALSRPAELAQRLLAFAKEI